MQKSFQQKNIKYKNQIRRQKLNKFFQQRRSKFQPVSDSDKILEYTQMIERIHNLATQQQILILIKVADGSNNQEDVRSYHINPNPNPKIQQEKYTMCNKKLLENQLRLLSEIVNSLVAEMNKFNRFDSEQIKKQLSRVQANKLIFQKKLILLNKLWEFCIKNIQTLGKYLHLCQQQSSTQSSSSFINQLDISYLCTISSILVQITNLRPQNPSTHQSQFSSHSTLFSNQTQLINQYKNTKTYQNMNVLTKKIKQSNKMLYQKHLKLIVQLFVFLRRKQQHQQQQQLFNNLNNENKKLMKQLDFSLDCLFILGNIISDQEEIKEQRKKQQQQQNVKMLQIGQNNIINQSYQHALLQQQEICKTYVNGGDNHHNITNQLTNIISQYINLIKQCLFGFFQFKQTQQIQFCFQHYPNNNNQHQQQHQKHQQQQQQSFQLFFNYFIEYIGVQIWILRILALSSTTSSPLSTLSTLSLQNSLKQLCQNILKHSTKIITNDLSIVLTNVFNKGNIKINKGIRFIGQSLLIYELAYRKLQQINSMRRDVQRNNQNNQNNQTLLAEQQQTSSSSVSNIISSICPLLSLIQQKIQKSVSLQQQISQTNHHQQQLQTAQSITQFLGNLNSLNNTYQSLISLCTTILTGQFSNYKQISSQLINFTLKCCQGNILCSKALQLPIKLFKMYQKNSFNGHELIFQYFVLNLNKFHSTFNNETLQMSFSLSGNLSPINLQIQRLPDHDKNKYQTNFVQMLSLCFLYQQKKQGIDIRTNIIQEGLNTNSKYQQKKNQKNYNNSFTNNNNIIQQEYQNNNFHNTQQSYQIQKIFYNILQQLHNVNNPSTSSSLANLSMTKQIIKIVNTQNTIKKFTKTSFFQNFIRFLSETLSKTRTNSCPQLVYNSIQLLNMFVTTDTEETEQFIGDLLKENYLNIKDLLNDLVESINSSQQVVELIEHIYQWLDIEY